MPIATGHEREELEAELQGRKILDIDYPDGPFGTKVSKLYCCFFIVITIAKECKYLNYIERDINPQSY